MENEADEDGMVLFQLFSQSLSSTATLGHQKERIKSLQTRDRTWKGGPRGSRAELYYVFANGSF